MEPLQLFQETSSGQIYRPQLNNLFVVVEFADELRFGETMSKCCYVRYQFKSNNDKRFQWILLDHFLVAMALIQ